MTLRIMQAVESGRLVVRLIDPDGRWIDGQWVTQSGARRWARLNGHDVIRLTQVPNIDNLKRKLQLAILVDDRRDVNFLIEEAYVMAEGLEVHGRALAAEKG